MNVKLVILRGKTTSGKSTAWHNLRERKEMRDWTFIDNASIKNMFDNFPNEERKKYGKASLHSILKLIMPTKRNIIIEESSEKTLKRYIRYYLKKYKYKIVTFQFEVSKKEAYKRDIQRGKDKWHPAMGKKWIDETHDYHERNFDKNGILVDTTKLNKLQVVRFILKELKLK